MYTYILFYFILITLLQEMKLIQRQIKHSLSLDCYKKFPHAKLFLRLDILSCGISQDKYCITWMKKCNKIHFKKSIKSPQTSSQFLECDTL
jgi:hypothetical protein